MRKTRLTIILSVTAICLTLFSCSSTPADEIRSGLSDIVSLKDVKLNEREPFRDLRSLLEQKAAKVIVLTHANMENSLLEAGNYSHALILVGQHCLIKITEPGNKEQSTSWGCQMPWGEGYTQKKGEVAHESNYINYLIGKPGASYSRVLFLFE